MFKIRNLCEKSIEELDQLENEYLKYKKQKKGVNPYTSIMEPEPEPKLKNTNNLMFELNELNYIDELNYEIFDVYSDNQSLKYELNKIKNEVKQFNKDKAESETG